ncbi:tetratricopeptide repeat domain 19 isoform 2-T3 [Cochliomyia hominivorax]
MLSPKNNIASTLIERNCEMNLTFASFPRIFLNFLNHYKLVPNVLLIYRRNIRDITDKYVLSRRRFVLNKAYFITYSISLFGLFNKDEEPEDKLITTIKRSILCINREEYDRAEQMLHLALKMAQDLKNKDGITYVYDIMANLAMEREQFKKAEKLFVDVMRRLISDGLPLDNPKILHISSKLAHIADLQGDLEKAKSGFIWTLGKLEECLKSDDVELKELWALTTNWFGQLLMKEKNFKHAEKCFKDAYECFKQIHGSDNSEAVTLLNDLGVVCTNLCPSVCSKRNSAWWHAVLACYGTWP